jgi:hypothetical protein
LNGDAISADFSPSDDALSDRSSDISSATDPSDVGGSSLVINEILANSLPGEPDWIELLVKGNESISLSQFSLVDDNAEHLPISLPDLLLEPGEFHVIYADSDLSEEDPLVLDFGLGNSDTVTLATLAGDTADMISWAQDESVEGVSWCRLPDGTGTFDYCEPTPGETNHSWEDTLPLETIFVSDRVLTLTITISDEDWAASVDAPLDEQFYPATIDFAGHVVENVAVRTKGNSSLSSVAMTGNHRFPFKVDLNYYDDNLDLFGFVKFNLNNGFKDPSFMRESIAYGLSRDFGVPAPRTTYVDLTVNEEHLGLYTLIEQVDGDFLEEHFEDGEGDCYKPEGSTGNLGYWGDDISSYPGMELTTNEDSSDHSAFLNFANIFNLEDLSEIPTVLDVDSALRYLAINTLLTNLDSYIGTGHNYYFYEDLGVFYVLLWDMNEAFGQFPCSCDREGLVGFLIDDPTCGPLSSKPLVERLFQVPAYVDTYYDYLQELIDGLFSPAAMAERINVTSELIGAYVEADSTTDYSLSDFESAIAYQDIAGAIGLMAFVEERGLNIQEQLDGLIPSENSGDGSCEMTGGPTGPVDPGNPCPDGICDPFEQANPEACPEDCD